MRIRDRKKSESYKPHTPFKAREIPKHVKINEKASSPLRKHKEKLEKMKERKGSLNINSLVMTYDPPKEPLAKDSL